MKSYRTRRISRRGARADSGNVRESRMTLYSEIANFNAEAECDGRATWSNDEQNLI